MVRNAPFFECAAPVLALFPKSQIQVLLCRFLEVSLALCRSLMILQSSGLMKTSMYVTVVLAPLSLLVNVALLFLVPFHGGNLALRMSVSSRWIELRMLVPPAWGPSVVPGERFMGRERRAGSSRCSFWYGYAVSARWSGLCKATDVSRLLLENLIHEVMCHELRSGRLEDVCPFLDVTMAEAWSHATAGERAKESL